jgi:hypothetical protein
MYLVIRRRPTFAKMAVWSLFWPIFAVVLVFRLIRPTHEMRENARRLRIERVAAAIEREAFEGDAIAEVFEFREVFYRYAGLAEAAATARAEFIDSVASLAATGRTSAVRHAVELAGMVGDEEAASRLQGLLSERRISAPLRRVDTSAVS